MTISRTDWVRTATLAIALVSGTLAVAQPPVNPGDENRPARGPGGGGGPMWQERKLLKRFDADSDGKLSIEEREKARAYLKTERESRGNDAGGGRPMRMGPGPGMGGAEEKATQGPSVSPADVKTCTGDLYDQTVLRTIFLDFDTSDWESELEDFYNSDVDVPATMTVDGKKYSGVGVHFRGASSYFGVRTGHKRSLNVSVDFTDDKLKLQPNGSDHGYTTLNLLNSHEDASFMSSVLYSTIANQYIVAPRANHVRVVINGESWGVYVNVEQFNKDFVKRNFKPSTSSTAKIPSVGHEARWKVKGNPGARSGLEYTGDDAAQYKQKYAIKSDDREEDWADLINLCRVLNTTPPGELEAELSPILDIDATLKFLALDVVLANGDGYWTRSSDYSLYKDKAGKFHIVPHDMNEAFQSNVMMPGGGGMGRRQAGGPGGGPPQGAGDGAAGPGMGGPDRPRPEAEVPVRRQDGEQQPLPPRAGGGESQPTDGQPVRDQLRRGPGGPGGGRGGVSGTELDPLVGLTDPAKPLRSKLLAVPALRERYLGYVREIAQKNLDWTILGPIVAARRAVIEDAISADTRKLSSADAFRRATSSDATAADSAGARQRGSMSLRGFADKRRAYLLSYTPKEAVAAQPSKEPEQR